MENKNDKIICSLCGDYKTTFFVTKKGFNLYKCLACGLVFIYPLPKSIDVYDDSYFSGAEKGYGYVDYDADKEPMTPVFEKYIQIFSDLGVKGGKLLDVGSATGFFINIAKNRGFEVSGVEISNYAAEIGRRKGLNIITGDLFTQRFESEYFDIITMFDVIEHVPDPKAVLLEAKRILKKGGLLVINTPDVSSVWARVLGSRWQLIMPPEHINYFSPKNIGDYLTQNGFAIEINTKIGKSFTLQYVLKMLYKWTGFRVLAKNLRGFLSKVSIPINLRDNFFMIVRKK